MQFLITELQFDLNCDSAAEELTAQESSELHEQYVGTIWEADSEDDLIDEITCAAGWCILSINYRHILRA